MTEAWTTVFSGGPAEAEIVRSKLEAFGIPVYLPEEAMRMIDPFLVGGGQALNRLVQVPESAVPRAQEVLADRGLDASEA